MKPRIGVLTSGGDCPGLNAVLRAVVLAADKLGWEVVGFRDGFEGLLPPGNQVILDRHAVNGIMALGGTILGTTNRGHFVAKVGAGHRTVRAMSTFRSAISLSHTTITKDTTEINFSFRNCIFQ